MREVRKMSNSILPFIQLKEEVASDCKEGRLPMLDFQVWKEMVEKEDGEKETLIKYEFYEKPMASKLMIMDRSALPHRIKVTTLSQEVVRRMKNTGRSVGEERRKKILTRMMTKMKRSGYNERMRRRVLVAGLRGYNNMVMVEEGGGRKVNRPRWDGARERRFKKMAAKSSWFRSKKKKQGGTGKFGKKGEKKRGREEESDIEAVMFVPHTPGGLLAKLLQEEDDRFRKGTGMKRIKMVERGGRTVKDIVSKTNPWAGDGCERDDCLPCMGERGSGGNCQQENIVYRIHCQECELGHIKAEYTGESSRTMYLRGKEHLDGLVKKNEKNALWKHCAQVHGGRQVKFTMKIVRSHKTPFTRQVQEGVEIDNSTANIIMNSKGEWNGSRIPRVVIEVGEEVQDEEGERERDISAWNWGEKDFKRKKMYKNGREGKESKRKGDK